MLGMDKGRPHIAKRKRQSSYDDGPTQGKHRRQSQQRSTWQPSIPTDPSCCSLRSQPALAQTSTVTIDSSAKDQLPTSSAWRITDTELSCDCAGIDGSSTNISPTLIDISFRPRFLPHSSYRAVIHDTREKRSIPFSQLARVVESFGRVGTISDTAVYQLQHHFFLVSGICWPASSQLSSGRTTLSTDTETRRIKSNATRPRPSYRRTTRASSQEHRQDSSDDNSNLNDSGSDSDGGSEDNGSGDDEHGQSCLTARKNIPWDEIDEQRLRVYKEEGKPWKWIFQKFPTRTPPAIRTRWNMIRHRVQ
jgi:hypothetical protein